MMDAGAIERSVRRRQKLARRGGRTIHRTGELPEVQRVETLPLFFKDARSGRTLISALDEERSYSVGGLRKKLVRTADVIGADGVQYTTRGPRPGQELINGLSDKIDSPVRVPRSAKRRNGKGSKGASRVLR